ncbi:MAG: membrane protein insertion efficiency factor YidD [Elusimicrobia bacterium]|nr:membrane protein insertion efficiency factor YidD [Elusimicrobiota bacterium]
MRLLSGGALAVIDLYRTMVRPFLPPLCRFHPSCSDYARQAVAAHGLARGALLGSRRLLRCHPFSAGGSDPVPLK